MLATQELLHEVMGRGGRKAGWEQGGCWRKAEDAGRGASGSEARRRRDGGPGRKMVAVGVVGARSWLAVGGLRWSRAVEGVW